MNAALFSKIRPGKRDIYQYIFESQYYFAKWPVVPASGFYVLHYPAFDSLSPMNGGFTRTSNTEQITIIKAAN